MRRYLPPILLLSTLVTGALVYLVINISPKGYMIEAAFVGLVGLAIAGWMSLPIYYLRKKWGTKDSPRFVLRSSIKSSLILGGGVVVILSLQILGQLTWITGLSTFGLAIVCERLL
jgi:hypothetical protein